MSTLVEILAIDEGGKSKGDAVTHLLLVSDANLWWIIHLGAKERILLQGVFAADGEACRVRTSRPGQVYGAFQISVDFVVKGTAELSAVVGVRVQDEVGVGEADGEVVFGELRLGGVEGHLVAEEPIFVAADTSAVHDGAAKVQRRV